MTYSQGAMHHKMAFKKLQTNSRTARNPVTILEFILGKCTKEMRERM
jgi:hypothetical protein